MTTAKATVYVPTLVGGTKLSDCLASVLEQTVRVDVVVADNSSGSSTAELLTERFPTVQRVGFGQNLGFGKALNRAISAYGTGPIILLNDDAVAEPDFAASLLREWEAGYAMVAAVLVSSGRPNRIDSAGVLADADLNAHDYLHGYSIDVLDSCAPPTGPTGGGALYDREIFNQCGGFDERIFLYYEDLDLALRLRARGVECALAPKARARHDYSASLGAGNPAKYRFTGWSRGYILRRYRVVHDLRSLVRVLAVEGTVSIGQALTAKSLAGLKGRIRGWRAARGLEPRQLPEGVEPVTSPLQTLRRKMVRRGFGRHPLNKRY